MTGAGEGDVGNAGAAGADDVAAGGVAHSAAGAGTPEEGLAPGGGQAVAGRDTPVAAAGGPGTGADAYGPFILTEPQLEAWGERIGLTAATPLVLALRGQLGAGKSVLARAVARGAGVAGHMPSPTFNLLYRYHAVRGIDVVHLDLYRLEDPEEVWELGWAELGVGEELVLMEWPERAEALLPEDRWDIWLDIPDEEATVRSVRAQRTGAAPALPAPPFPGDAA